MRNIENPKPKAVKRRQKDNQGQQKRVIECNVTITSWPSNEYTLFTAEGAKHDILKRNISVEKSNNFREEVAVMGILHGVSSDTHYPVRFTHPRTIQEARKLRPGQHICVLNGSFNKRHGRKEVEFVVHDFIAKAQTWV